MFISGFGYGSLLDPRDNLIMLCRSYNVINWFNNIENKKDCIFIQFDILEEAIFFAKSLIDIDDHKIRTIKHCRKSLLFHKNVA